MHVKRRSKSCKPTSHFFLGHENLLGSASISRSSDRRLGGGGASCPACPPPWRRHWPPGPRGGGETVCRPFSHKCTWFVVGIPGWLYKVVFFCLMSVSLVYSVRGGALIQALCASAPLFYYFFVLFMLYTDIIYLFAMFIRLINIVMMMMMMMTYLRPFFDVLPPALPNVA